MTAKTTTNIEAAMHRAIIRASRRVEDITTRAGAAAVLRELFDGERIYLKELPDRHGRIR